MFAPNGAPAILLELFPSLKCKLSFSFQTSSRKGPKERIVIEELRFFRDQNYWSEFTNLKLDPELQLLEPIPEIGLEAGDLIVGICDHGNICGWTPDQVYSEIEKQGKRSSLDFKKVPWYLPETLEATDFSLTYIKKNSVTQAKETGLLSQKKVLTITTSPFSY